MQTQGILVNLTVSEDKLEVYLDILPGADGPEHVDLAYLEGMLEAQGIQFGIDGDALTKAAEKAAIPARVDHLLIARGKRALKGSPEYIRLKDRLFSPKEKNIAKQSHVDFKEFSPYIMVKKGEPLGKKMKPLAGEPGTNVFGESITPGKKDIKQLEAGENTFWKEDVVFASVSGNFEFDGKHFSVSNTLSIEGNVDYSTGHISFAGDVIIHGEIRDGFRVAAGGSVFCKKTLDASEILCRKDLQIEGGIKGRHTGMVRVQGSVETKFIENCMLEAQQGIAVKSSILDSEIYTLGSVIMGDKKSSIVGGVVYAEKGVSTINLGSARNSHTEIFCGISYILMRKLKHLQSRLTVISGKLQKLRQLPETDEHLQLIEKSEKALKILQQSIGKYMIDQYTDFSAEIRVSGTIFPGSHITICDRNLTIKEAMNGVLIFYDKEKNCISTKNIE